MKKSKIQWILIAIPSLLVLYWSIALYIISSGENYIEEYKPVGLVDNTTQERVNYEITIIKTPDASLIGWNKYVDKDLGFSIDYPAEWGVRKWIKNRNVIIPEIIFAFGTDEMLDVGGYWAFAVQSTKKYTIDEVNNMLTQRKRLLTTVFDERDKKEVSKIVVDGVDGEKTMTTNSAFPEVASVAVFLKASDKILLITGGITVKEYSFDTFYKSLKF